MPVTDAALRLASLTKRFGRVLACQDVGFDVAPGEALGIIGESGSGKTTVLRCIAGDVTPDDGTALLRHAGKVLDLFALPAADRRALRIGVVSIVYQDPAQGLNMRISAGGNIAERLIAAGWRNFGQLRARAAELLNRVDVPLDRMDDPVGTFSGGMMQRVQLAKAVANNPSLLLLDEPTTGLDASIAAGVLDLIRDLIEESGVTALVVSHDMTVISMLASRAVVLRGGRMVEAGLTDQLLDDPQHPYSQHLVAAARGWLA
jgi:phosphonate C-P lyase system protein PhnK